MEETFRIAESALEEALRNDASTRLDAMTQFMQCFESLAQQIANGDGSWDVVRSWAHNVAKDAMCASVQMSYWQMEMARLFHYAHDEVHAERALDRRSQHAFAREAFRDTPVDQMLADFEDAEFDQKLHDEAARIALDGPSYAPSSHWWWRNRSR